MITGRGQDLGGHSIYYLPKLSPTDYDTVIGRLQTQAMTYDSYHDDWAPLKMPSDATLGGISTNLNDLDVNMNTFRIINLNPGQTALEAVNLQ